MSEDLNVTIISEFETVEQLANKLKVKLAQVQKITGIDLKLNLDLAGLKDLEESTKQVQYKIQKVFKDSKISGEGYTDLQTRVEQIKNSTDEYAKVTIQTYANTKKLKSAVIEYTDDMGKLTRETMGWTNVLDRAEGVQKRIFKTKGFTFIDNKAKNDVNLERSLNNLDNYINKLNKIKTSYELQSGVKDETNLKTLNGLYDDLIIKINKFKQSNVVLNQEQNRDIKFQIENLNNLSTKFKDQEKTVEKGFNFQNYKEVTNELVRIKDGNDLYNTSLIAGHRLINANVQETKEYYKVTQQVQDGNWMKNIGIYIDKNTGKMYQFNKSIKDNMIDTLTWSKAISTAVTRVAQWLAGTNLVFGVIHGVQDGINKIIELDESMIGLKKVTSETEEVYRSFIGIANEMAISVGHSTKAAIDATTSFAKLGYSIKESSELAKQALIYSNIGDIDIATATENIVGILKGFNLTISDTQRILDSTNEVGNNFAITSGGIGSALKRSSSTLKEANNTLEQSIGLITAANSAIQDPQKVGTALKTVSMRLRGVKDDMGEIVPKLRETVKELSGVEIMQDENTYKSTYDILKSVAAVWNNLTDVKRATLTEIMFGKHQGAVGASLLQNFNVAIQATETAINSAGSAAKEQERYMDGINAKINAFKETSTKLATQMVNSDLMKGIIEFGTSIQRVLSLTIDKIGALGTTFVLASGGLTIFRKDFRDSIINLIPPLQKLDSFTKYYLDTLNTKIVFKKKAIAEDRLEGLSTKSLTADLWRLTIAEKAVAIGSMAMQAAITMGISLAISGVISLISKWINRQEELKQKNQEVIESYQEVTQKYSDTISYLQSEGKQYDELKNKTSLTTEEQKKLAEVKGKLIDIFPELLVGYDKENNIILDQTKSTSDLIELLKEKNKLENQKLLSNGDNALEETQKTITKTSQELLQLKSQLELLEKRPKPSNRGTTYNEGEHTYNTRNIEDMTDKIEQLKKEQIEGKNVTNELVKAEEDLRKIQIERKGILDKISVKENERRTEMSKLKPYISAIINEYDGLDEAQRKMIANMVNITPENLFNIKKGDFTQFIADTQKQIDSLKDNVNLKNISFAIALKAPQEDDIKDYFDSILKLAQDTKQSPIELTKKFPLKADSNTIQKGLDAFMKEIESKLSSMVNGKEKDDLKQLFNELSNLKFNFKVEGTKDETIKETKKDLETLTKDLEFYYKMLDELHDKNKLSKSSVDEIFKTYKDLLPYIGDEVQLREKVNQKIQDEEKLQKEAYQNMIANSNEYYNAKIKGNNDVTNKLSEAYKVYAGNLGETYKVDLNNYKSLEQAKADMTTNLLKNLLKEWGKYAGSFVEDFSQYWDEAKGDFNGDLYYGLRWNPEETKKIEGIRDKLNSFKKKFNEITIDPIKVDFTPVNSSGVTAEKEKKSPSEQIRNMDMKTEKYNEEKQAIENIAKELTKNKAIEDNLYGDDLIAKKTEDINLLQQKSSWLDKLHDKQTADRNASGQLLKNFGFDVQGENIVNYTQKMQEWIDKANNTNSSVEARKDAMEHAKNLQEQIKLFYSLNKEISENRTQWQQLQTEVNKLNLDIVRTKIDDTTKAFEKFSTHSKELLGDLDLKEVKLDENDIDGQLSITNERKKIVQDEIDEKLKELERLKSIKAESKEEQETLNEAFKKEQDGLRDLQIEYERLNKTAKDTNDKKIKLAEDVESKITDMLKKEAEERKKIIEKEFEAKKKAIEDEYKTRLDTWNKIKKIYNSENAEDDRKKELSATQGELDKLRQEYQTSLRDTSSAGQLRTEQLRKSIEDQEKKINELITKQERERYNDELDDNISKIEKEKSSKLDSLEDDKKNTLDNFDNQWSAKKISDIAKEAFATGTFKDIEGNIKNVKDVYSEFLDKFENGATSSGKKLKEDFIKNFDIATESVKDLDNSSQNFTNIFDEGLKNIGTTVANIMIPNFEKLKGIIEKIDMSKFGIDGITSTKVTLPQSTNISSIANNVSNVRNQPVSLKNDIKFSFGDVKTNMNKKEFVSMVYDCKDDVTRAVGEGLNGALYRR